jgi:hypothetical protein
MLNLLNDERDASERRPSPEACDQLWDDVIALWEKVKR